MYIIWGRGSGKQSLLYKCKECLEKPYIELDEYEKEILRLFGLVHRDLSEDIIKPKIDEESFTMAGIQLTDYQRETISRLQLVYSNISEVIIPIMRKTTTSIEQLANSLIIERSKPQKDYNQRHNPWKKERFYY